MITNPPLWSATKLYKWPEKYIVWEQKCVRDKNIKKKTFQHPKSVLLNCKGKKICISSNFKGKKKSVYADKMSMSGWRVNTIENWVFESVFALYLSQYKACTLQITSKAMPFCWWSMWCKYLKLEGKKKLLW